MRPCRRLAPHCRRLAPHCLRGVPPHPADRVRAPPHHAARSRARCMRGATGVRTVDSLKAQQAELRKGLEAIRAQLGSSLQAQAQAVERSAKSVDELRQSQESLRSDLVAVVERELSGAQAASRTAAGGAAESVDHEKDVEELRAHDLDHEERLLRQQAGMDELRAMLHAAAHLAQARRAPAATPAAAAAAAAPDATTASRCRRRPRRALPFAPFALPLMLPTAAHQHRCRPRPRGPGRATDTRPAAAQAQRAEIDILRGEVGSLQAAGELETLRGELGSLRAGSDISSRTTATSFQSAASSLHGSEPPAWSRSSTLESPGPFERQSAAGELRTTRASLPGTCMDIGHSTHEMNADI